MTVHLCDQCGRVPVAGDRSAYNVERGNLIVRHGFCTCRPSASAPPSRPEGEQEMTGPVAKPVVREALEGAGARHGR